MWEWRSMIHKGVQLVLSGRRLRLRPHSTACKLVDRKKTNTELNKLKASRTHMIFSRLRRNQDSRASLLPPHAGECCDVT
jgi:hypothetical protein